MVQHKRIGFLAALLLVLTVVPALAQDKVEMWIAFTDSRLTWTQQKAAEFHAQFPDLPEINVVGKADYATVSADTEVAFDDGDLPALVHYPEAASQNALDSGYFTTIEKALNNRNDINGVPVNLNDFIGSVRDYYTMDGDFTSMPWNASAPVLFSNMNLLNAAGIAAPPPTWADMDAACAAIMALDNHPPYCFTWPNHGWFFEEWLAQQNALFANNDNGRSNRATEVVFNSDAGTAILRWLVDMKDKGYLYYSGAQGEDSWAAVDDAFAGQQVAMAIYSSSGTAAYNNIGSQNGFSVTASNLPYNQAAPGGWTGNIIGGGSLWLADNLPGDLEDAALTWLFWLTNTDNTADWHKNGGDLPVRESAVQTLTNSGWFSSNPNFMAGVQEITDSRSTAATAGALLGDFPAVRATLTTALDQALQTPGADLKAILDNAAANVNSSLGEYNALNAG